MVKRSLVLISVLIALLILVGAQQRPPATEPAQSEEASCLALLDLPNLTITSASLKPASGSTPQHCYIRGTLAGRIRFHMQLPLRVRWNGRLLNIGDGGKDGALNLANDRLAQGYAAANSNSGHDSGAEPYASFGTTLESVIDFGHRAVHLTANASKTVVRAFYGRAPDYSYFEGCSTGGRQGLMEAQRYPEDFDGIVAGAPVADYGGVNLSHLWFAERMMKDRFAGNLAFDTDGDGVAESLRKLEILREAVIAKCDTNDGIKDGLVDDPLACDFGPEADLAERTCRGDVNADDCFTRRQLQTISAIYRGPQDSGGRRIRKGLALASEFEWSGERVAHKGNNMTPAALGYGADHFNFLFYKQSPGVPPPVVNDLTFVPKKKGRQPEFAWWEFNADDVTAGKGAFMSAILDATDPDLSAFLNRSNGRLLLYHGWGDGVVSAEPTLDYYKDVVATTFGGNINTASEKVRLFMIPGMGHCVGGPGCDSWDRLAPLVDWVENGKAPDFLVARHVTKDVVDNERRMCAYPQRAVYVGPGSPNDRANWVEKNFTCH